MKEHLRAFSSRLEETVEAFKRGKLAWLSMLSALAVATALTFLAYKFEKRGFFNPVRASVGHITRAYGTVTKVGSGRARVNDAWGRLETGRNILAPLALGDQVQTGDDSAAEILFFGGSVLKLEAGTVMRFEEDGENVSMRVILGRAYLEHPLESSGDHFVFRKSDGSIADFSSGKKLLLTLSAIDRLEDAVDIQVVETDYSPSSIGDLELRYLAHGEELANFPLLTPPIPERDHELKVNERKRMVANAPITRPAFPANESHVDVEKEYGVSMKWDKNPGFKEDPVVAYEVLVKPAFNYGVEDRARKIHVIRSKTEDKEIEKIGGGGVFLWSVRPVTSSGKRGPASQYRWLEVKFPKQLLAPALKKPKIE